MLRFEKLKVSSFKIACVKDEIGRKALDNAKEKNGQGGTEGPTQQWGRNCLLGRQCTST
jgi:hypothetical protein